MARGRIFDFSRRYTKPILYCTTVYTTLTLMRFKPRFSAVLQILLSAEGRGRFAF